MGNTRPGRSRKIRGLPKSIQSELSTAGISIVYRVMVRTGTNTPPIIYDTTDANDAVEAARAMVAFRGSIRGDAR